MTKNKNILLLTLWGAIGFGIGGAIGGAGWFSLDAPYLGFPVFGAIGGVSLGLALKDRRKAGMLALACAIGFGAGFLTGFFVVLTIWEPVPFEKLFIGAVGGAFGGASLGLALRNWRKAGLLALAGAAGFGVAAQVYEEVIRGLIPQEPYMLEGVIILAIWGAIGGASLGATLGYLEKRKAD